MFRFKYIVLITVFFILSCFLLFKEGEQKGQDSVQATTREEKTKKRKPEGDVFGVEPKDLCQSVWAHGTLQGNEVELKFSVSGVLEGCFVEPGDYVRQGTLIGKINAEEALLRTAYREAALESKKVLLKQAQEKWEYHQKLYQTGYLSEQKLNDLSFDVQRLRGEVKAASLELASAQKECSKTQLKAPFSGVISEITAVTGEFLSQAETVAKLIAKEKLSLTLSLSEKYMHLVQLGQKVYLDSSLEGNKKQLIGAVKGVVPQVDTNSQTVLLKVELLEKLPDLLPGMFVKARVVLYEKKGALMLPINAIKTEQGAVTVRVLTELGGFETRPVKIGYKTSQMVEILKGLKAGEKVWVARNVD